MFPTFKCSEHNSCLIVEVISLLANRMGGVLFAYTTKPILLKLFISNICVMQCLLVEVLSFLVFVFLVDAPKPASYLEPVCSNYSCWHEHEVRHAAADHASGKAEARHW